jgi:hypothetical protein
MSIMSSAEGRCCDDPLQGWQADKLPIPCAERRRFSINCDFLAGRRVSAIFRIKLGKGGWKVSK